MKLIRATGLLYVGLLSSFSAGAQATADSPADAPLLVAVVDPTLPRTPSSTPAPTPAPYETQSSANSSHIGISANVAVLTGFGVSIGIPVFDQFNLRLAGNAFSISRDINEDNDSGGSNTYRGKIKLQTYGLFADWHPFHGAFRLTGGILKNGNKLTVDSVNNNGTVGIGNCKYASDANDPLMAHGQTNFKKSAPYAGLGWGGNMNSAPGFFGTFDLGVIFSGSANVTLKASGRALSASGGLGCSPVADAGSDPLVQAQVAKDQADLNDSADKVKVWPVIGFGFGWRF